MQESQKRWMIEMDGWIDRVGLGGTGDPGMENDPFDRYQNFLSSLLFSIALSLSFLFSFFFLSLLSTLTLEKIRRQIKET